MSWRGNGKSGEVSSPSVARRSLVHGGVTATTVIFCFPSSENPCPSSKRICPALIPFGVFSTVSCNGPMFVFLVPLNRPKEERKARSCVTATPGRAGPGGAGRPHALARGCWRRGEIGPGRKVHAPARAAAPSPQNSRPSPLPSLLSSVPGRANEGAAGRAGRGQPPPAARGEAALLEPFLPFNPAVWAGRGS